MGARDKSETSNVAHAHSLSVAGSHAITYWIKFVTQPTEK